MDAYFITVAATGFVAFTAAYAAVRRRGGLAPTDANDASTVRTGAVRWWPVLPAVLGVGFGLIAAAVRPYANYNGVHIEMLVALAVLGLSAAGLLAIAWCTPRSIATGIWQWTLLSLAAGFVCGWTIARRNAFDDLTGMMIALWAVTAVVGQGLLYLRRQPNP